MGQTVDALYDGRVLLLQQPLSFAPQTRLRVTIEEVLTEPGQTGPRSFFEIAKSLNLEGPADWSENVDKYLYGDRD